jgi:hypothetical protein
MAANASPPVLHKSSKAEGKARAVEGGGYGSSPFAPRRISLMGKELERVEHIVVEVGSPDAPRFVSCSALKLLKWWRILELTSSSL